MPQNVNIKATMQIDSSGAQTIGGAAPVYSKGPATDINLADGTGTNQANRAYMATRTILTGANDDLDLNGVLTDVFGNLLSLTIVKGIIIRSDPANTTNLTVGAAPSNTFTGPFGASTHTITIRPGGFFGFAAPQTGYTVTPATGDILRIANAAGASANYIIEIVGF